MLYFEIIFGAVLAFAAFLCLIVSVEEPGALFLFALFGVVGGFLISAGVHRNWAHSHARHVEVYRAATGQGYPVRSSDVHSGYGTTLDVRVGRCVFPLEGRKVDGRWRFGVEESGQGSTGGIVFLSPTDVAKLREVCPA